MFRVHPGSRTQWLSNINLTQGILPPSFFFPSSFFMWPMGLPHISLPPTLFSMLSCSKHFQTYILLVRNGKIPRDYRKINKVNLLKMFLIRTLILNRIKWDFFSSYMGTSLG